MFKRITLNTLHFTMIPRPGVAVNSAYLQTSKYQTPFDSVNSCGILGMTER